MAVCPFPQVNEGVFTVMYDKDSSTETCTESEDGACTIGQLVSLACPTNNTAGFITRHYVCSDDSKEPDWLPVPTCGKCLERMLTH